MRGTARCPVIVKVASTAGFSRIISSAWSWRSCICSGDDPSRAIITPQMKLLSPAGRKVFGMTMKSPTVPARQTTQISTEIHRRRRNHQSDSAINSEHTLFQRHRPLVPSTFSWRRARGP